MTGLLIYVMVLFVVWPVAYRYAPKRVVSPVWLASLGLAVFWPMALVIVVGYAWAELSIAAINYLYEVMP